jgi:bacterioferritin
MGDNVSARLFEIIIEEEQEHASHFDNVGNHIKNLGDAYLSKIAGTSASTGPSSKGFVNMGEDEAG